MTMMATFNQGERQTGHKLWTGFRDVAYVTMFTVVKPLLPSFQKAKLVKPKSGRATLSDQ